MGEAHDDHCGDEPDQFLSGIFPTDEEGNIDPSQMPEEARWLADSMTLELQLAEVGLIVKLLGDACEGIKQTLAEKFGELAELDFDDVPDEAKEAVAQGIAMGSCYEAVGRRLARQWQKGGYNEKVREAMGGVIASDAEEFLRGL
jgi:hypothetical protein